MAIKVSTGKVYHCQSPHIGSGSIQVIGGPINVVGSNVTKYDANGKLITPSFSELVSTEDTLPANSISLVSGLPEWIGFSGTATEIWIKMGIDVRIEPGE